MVFIRQERHPWQVSEWTILNGWIAISDGWALSIRIGNLLILMYKHKSGRLNWRKISVDWC